MIGSRVVPETESRLRVATLHYVCMHAIVVTRLARPRYVPFAEHVCIAREQSLQKANTGKTNKASSLATSQRFLHAKN